MVVVLAPSYHYDKLIITLVSDAIQSGLRKLFSVVDYEALLSEVCVFIFYIMEIKVRVGC